MKLLLVVLVATVAVAAARTLTRAEKKELSKRLLNILEKRKHEEAAREPKGLGDESEDGDKKIPFEKAVMGKLKNLEDGVGGLLAAPFMGKIIDTFDSLERVCWHVMGFMHAHDAHEEESSEESSEEGTSAPEFVTGAPDADTGAPDVDTGAPEAQTDAPTDAPDVQSTDSVLPTGGPTDSPSVTEEKRILNYLLEHLKEGTRKKRATANSRQKRNAWWAVDWALVGHVCRAFGEFHMIDTSSMQGQA